MAGATFWDEFAERWVVEPPQVPSPEDLAWFQGELDQACPEPGPVLVMGATPEFQRLALPPGSLLLATDFSSGMLRKVWRGAADPGPAAVRGDWRRLPWKDGAIQVVLGDGCFGVLPGEDAVREVCGEVARVLRSRGRFLLRCFVRDPACPAVDSLFDELRAGRVERIGWFRWKVAMALQNAGERQVDRHRVWEEWQARLPDWEARIGDWGLSPEFALRILRWKGEHTPLNFPTLDQVLDFVKPRLDVLEVHRAALPDGACFPRLVLAKPA